MVCLGTGCDVVRASSYAHLWGLPLPVYGVAMYAVLALLIFAEGLVGARRARGIRFGVAAISGAGFIASLYLSGIEAFVLHAWCAWCVVSALAISFILMLAVLEIRRPAPSPEPAAAVAEARRLLIVSIVALIVGVPGFLFLMRSGTLPPVQTASAEILRERLVRPDSHIAGNPAQSGTPVTVVEFGDFQCPACGRAQTVVGEIRRKYADQVRFVFRQFPLSSVHMHADSAAEASECAAEQGKFWEAEEKLYQNQNDLSEPALERYAEGVGLNLDRFRRCMSTSATRARVRRDVEDGHALGVRVTPTFFVGGHMIEGPFEITQFAALIDHELASGGASRAQSAAPPTKPLEAGPRIPPSSRDPSTPASNATASSTTLLGTRPGGAFSQLSSSAMACSEEEAKRQQPVLISTPEARQFFESKDKALFVDVRTAKDFKTGRIPGAINVPAEEIERRWSRLPKDRSIVLYEGGRSSGDICASSRAAGRVLLANGFSRDRVKVYQDGLAAWENAGLAVER